MKGVLVSAFAIAVASCGYVQAQGTSASVSGNNTAVVIRRANVASSSGHHLICVPVRPFDITGQGAGTLTLEDILPASLYTGAEVTVDSGTTSAKTYTVSEGKWVLKDPMQGTQDATEADAPVVSTKEVLWLWIPADKQITGRAVTATEGDPIVFCGEENGEMDTVQTTDGLHSMGNATSSVKTLGEIFNGTFGQGTQISRIETRGDDEYTRYYYYKSVGWKKFTADGVFDVDLSQVEIQPGEAFYYYAKPGTSVTK